MALRVVFVLDPHRLVEGGGGEAGDVSRREHVLASADASVLVDDDPVLDRESGGGGKLGPGLDSEPGHDHVGLERAAVLGRDACDAACAFDPGHRRAGEYLDALVAVVVGDERGEVGREDARADPRVGEDDRHRPAVHRQRRSDLRADEAASDHQETRTAAGERTEPPVVVEGAEVDHLVAPERQTAGPAAGREQQPLVGVGLARVVGRLAGPAGRARRSSGRAAARRRGRPSHTRSCLRRRPSRALSSAAAGRTAGAPRRPRRQSFRPGRARGCPCRPRRRSSRPRRSDTGTCACVPPRRSGSMGFGSAPLRGTCDASPALAIDSSLPPPHIGQRLSGCTTTAPKRNPDSGVPGASLPVTPALPGPTPEALRPHLPAAARKRRHESPLRSSFRADELHRRPGKLQVERCSNPRC